MQSINANMKSSGSVASDVCVVIVYVWFYFCSAMILAPSVCPDVVFSVLM
jgi:hypothetical protein